MREEPCIHQRLICGGNRHLGCEVRVLRALVRHPVPRVEITDVSDAFIYRRFMQRTPERILSLTARRNNPEAADHHGPVQRRSHSWLPSSGQFGNRTDNGATLARRSGEALTNAERLRISRPRRAASRAWSAVRAPAQ